MPSIANISAGIQIFAKYCDINKEWFGAAHDFIWGIEESLVTNEEDRTALENLGWHIADGCWSAYT